MEWEVGQMVQVQSRTWAGINKPGGCAKIIKVHRTVDGDYIEGLDVKYVLGGGGERNVDPAIVSPLETLERGGRKRRGRDFLHQREEDLKQKCTNKVDTSQPQQQAEANSLSSRLNQDAALRESESSRQSITTPFSTPQKRRPQKNPPKKVTPIPKLVKIGKKCDSVSPLTEQMDTFAVSKNEEQEKLIVAPRGLCFDTVAEQDASKKTSSTKSNIIAETKALPKSIPRQPLGQQNAPNAGMKVDDRKLAAQPKQPSSSQLSVQSSAKKKRIVGVRLMTTTGFVSTRCVATKIHHKESFTRTVSAYGKNDSKLLADAAAAPTRKPLLDVYREEEKKARDFIDEMVAPRTEDPQLEDDVDGSKEDTRFIRTTPRYDEFLSTVGKIFTKVDDEEIREEHFHELFHQMTSNSFGQEELNHHIQLLCKEEKLMKSDGMLYKID